MKKKNLIKLINEEISEFDFLHNNEEVKEEENYKLLKNEDFQKQFICDSLLNREKLKQKVSDARVTDNSWSIGSTVSKLKLRYDVDIEYNYDQSKEPAKLTLIFDSEGINVDVDTTTVKSYDRDVPSTGEASFSDINWDDIQVNMYTNDGDTIDFIALKKAPEKIRILFIREYTEDIIANQTSIDTDRMKKDNIKSIPYC